MKTDTVLAGNFLNGVNGNAPACFKPQAHIPSHWANALRSIMSSQAPKRNSLLPYTRLFSFCRFAFDVPVLSLEISDTFCGWISARKHPPSALGTAAGI